MSLEIVNCTWKFQVQCPRQWSGLRETADPKVRLCESCLREVHWCSSDEDVRLKASQGACVAVAPDRDHTEALLGEVIPAD